jgi:hypothetical protein
LGIKKKRGKMCRDLGNKNDPEEKMKQLQNTYYKDFSRIFQDKN